MSLVEAAAVVIALGSLVFGIGGAMPTSRVFAVADPDGKLRILAASPAVWLFSQVGFAVGPTIVVLGLAILTFGFTGGPATALGLLGTALFLIGVVCWDWHVYLRAADPAAFARGLIPPWLFQVYTVLTCLGLVAFGAAFFFAGYPPWLAILTAVVGLASLVAFLVMKDMFPFVYYILLSVVAWAIGAAWLPVVIVAGLVATAAAYFLLSRLATSV